MTQRSVKAKKKTLPDADFERHAQQTVHFFSRRVPPRLREALASSPSGTHVVDVGCGDGQLAWALMETDSLPPRASFLGVDISPVRIERFQRLTKWPALLANGESLTEMPDAVADICISTMVMEHVSDDEAYASALARITKPGGMLFLTTVLRKRGAWYFRKAPDGRRVLDPTHVREYSSVQEVKTILEDAGFQVLQVGLDRLVFPILVPALRLLNAVWPIPNVQYFFLRQPWAMMESLGLPIPRYREIQLLLRRRQGNPQEGFE